MQVWHEDLQRHEGTVRDIIQVAQGEMALEEILKQVRQRSSLKCCPDLDPVRKITIPAQVQETRNTYELDLINYQNKCWIIRGGDDLVKLKENTNQRAAMKLCPYYKVIVELSGDRASDFSSSLQVFEEEAITWEDKLNRISSLFDVWIDVLRRCVYLEGIFR